MNEAMNLTFGDYIFLEVALVHYMKDLDLSMQSGQYISELLGKLEYELSQIRLKASKPPTENLKPTPIPGEEGT